MNILPKKRWHVRTKDNIARVRRDEAKAADEEKQREQRALLAEQEARTSLMRERARSRVVQGEIGEELRALESRNQQLDVAGSTTTTEAPFEHVNFFRDLEDGETTHTANKEHEVEKKKEQEEYEKKIGLLTYLGQDTHELTGERAWWQKLPEKRNSFKEEEKEEKEQPKGQKLKALQDPLTDIRKYLGCEGVQKYMNKKSSQLKISSGQTSSSTKKEKKHKKRKRDTSSSSSSDSSDSEGDRKRRKKAKKRKKHHKKSKKRKKKSSASDEEDLKEEQRLKLEKQKKLEKLRLERLAREKVERARTTKLLNGETVYDKAENKVEETPEVVSGKRKYNSQFNPEVARQNKLDATKKYWLE